MKNIVPCIVYYLNEFYLYEFNICNIYFNISLHSS